MLQLIANLFPGMYNIVLTRVKDFFFYCAYSIFVLLEISCLVFSYDEFELRISGGCHWAFRVEL